MSAELPVDQAAIDKLQKMGGAKFVRQMISLFVDFGGKKVKEARAALEQSNIHGVGKCVHAIKSSALNLGARQVFDIAAEMEQLTKDGGRDALPDLQTSLEKEFEVAKAQLELRANELE